MLSPGSPQRQIQQFGFYGDDWRIYADTYFDKAFKWLASSKIIGIPMTIDQEIKCNPDYYAIEGAYKLLLFCIFEMCGKILQ